MLHLFEISGTNVNVAHKGNETMDVSTEKCLILKPLILTNPILRATLINQNHNGTSARLIPLR